MVRMKLSKIRAREAITVAEIHKRYILYCKAIGQREATVNSKERFYKYELSKVVDLEDDNGNVLSCPIVDAFEFEENEYVLAQNPEDESVYLFRSTEEGELIVPEEAEFDKVTEYYTNVLVND